MTSRRWTRWWPSRGGPGPWSARCWARSSRSAGPRSPRAWERARMPSEPRQAPSLAEVQALLYELMPAPTGVAPALAARGLAADALDGLLAGDQRLGAVARLGRYD